MQNTLYNFDYKNRVKFYILFIVLIFQTAVILYYSSQTAAQSAELSRIVMSKLDWVPKSVPREKSNGSYGGITLHFIVRKLAHMYNYFVTGCIIYAIRCYCGKELYKDIICVSYGVFLGTADEIFQHFVPGRSGQITDVCVDLLGTIIGYIAVYLLFSLIFSKRCVLWELTERK